MAPYQISGPFLTAALFCEEARQKDGFLSVSSIIDRMVVVGTGPVMFPTSLELTLVVIFRSGDSSGHKTISLGQVAPSQYFSPTVPLFDFPVYFQGGEHGAGVIARVRFVVQEPGLHWFEVSLDGYPVTRIPLTVLYQGR